MGVPQIEIKRLSPSPHACKSTSVELLCFPFDLNRRKRRRANPGSCLCGMMDGHDSLSDRPDPSSLSLLSLIDQLPDPNATQILKCEDAASSFFRPACAGGGRVGAPGHHRFAVGVFPPSTCHSPPPHTIKFVSIMPILLAPGEDGRGPRSEKFLCSLDGAAGPGWQ